MSFINLKRLRKNKDGEAVVSLTDKIIDNLAGVSLLYANKTVLADESCRPDMLALKWYGNKEYWWVILKYNAISNPYSLNEGMLYDVPDLASFLAKTGKLSSQDEVDVPDTLLKTLKNKIYTIDPRKVAYNKKKSPTDKETTGLGVKINGTEISFGTSTGAGGIADTLNKTETTVVSGTDVNTVCVLPCDNANPDICLLCSCKPKASDVLAYKIAQDAKLKNTTINTPPTTPNLM